MQQVLAHFDKGEGKLAVVFIHGFCESKTLWENFFPYFAQQYRLIALDLGGFGDSKDLLPKEVSMETLAQQVKELLEALRVDQCVLVGHSLGGYVSLAFAEAYPEKVRGLCLFHSTALADSEEKKKSRNQVMEFVANNGVFAYVDNLVELLFYAKRKKELQAKIDFIKNIGYTTPDRTVIEVTRAMRDRKDRTQVLKNSTYPVLFIIGKEDSLVPFESYKEQMHYPANAIINIFHETGHMGMLERERESRLIMQYFLRLCYDHE